MNTAEFYGKLFPKGGLRCLAVFRGGLGQPPQHEFYSNDVDFVAAATDWSSKGKNVYHACAVYATDESRKGDNAAAAKALWVDLDVGPTKPHKSQKEAAHSILNYVAELQLPMPTLVSSGSGVHAYFTFEKPITPEKWKDLAALNAACMNFFGVKHDSSRTQDIASILRIPGTKNYKTDPAKDVRVLKAGDDTTARTMYELLTAYADANGVTVTAPLTLKDKAAPANDLIGVQEYPPSNGDLIAKACHAIREVASTGGDVSYEIWWRALGVAKHTVDPQGTAAAWTANRAATGHDKSDYIKLMDSWPAGPTTCENFSQHSTKCAGCEFNGKITSPIQLGVEEAPPLEVPTVVDEVVPAPKYPEMPGEWKFMAPWIQEDVAAFARTGIRDRKMTMSVQQDDGTFTHKVFCNSLWQVMQRVRTLDHEWLLEIGYEEYEQQKHKTFLLESKIVTTPNALREAFAAKGLHILEGNHGMRKTVDIITREQELLRRYGIESAVYGALGWCTYDNRPRGVLTGDFVLGDTLFSPKKQPKQIMLADSVSDQFRHGYGTAGDVEDWVDQVDWVYNRPGAMPYQFVIAAMFAAPLVRLVPAQGQWHGIPIALVGDSGAAKTTTARVALSIYGPPDTAQFAANSGKDGQGDTINAFATKIGTMQNLPFVADEMTNVATEQLSAIMYMLTQGQRKDRSTSDGSLVPNPMRWDTISLATANESFHEKLRMLDNEHTKDATQLRCFEIVFKESDLRTIFMGVTKSDIEDDLLRSNYGCVGREWIQWLVDNRDRVTKRLGELRRSFKVDNEDTSRHRFYIDLLVTVFVAQEFAKEIGFIKWDTAEVEKWAKDQLRSLREEIQTKDWDSTISEFLASLHGKTIVTKRFSLGRGRRAIEALLEPIASTVVPVARKAIEDRRFVVTNSYVQEWAKKNRTTPSALLEQMHERGFLLSPMSRPPTVSIGSGSPVVRPGAICWELHYDLVVGEELDKPKTDGNVVTFPAAEPTAEGGDQVHGTSSATP